jgi:RoxA-like, cytochrome c-like
MMKSCFKCIACIGGCLVIAAIGLWVFAALQIPAVRIPAYEKPGELKTLPQGWSEADRTWFHHTPQGTQIMPYKWFLALEQPCGTPWSCGKFSDQEYLGRFGFIAGVQDAKLNPAGLPIGFAIDNQFRNPLDGSMSPVVGFTCAACHTGELHYGNHAVRVEGGPAMTNLDEFLKAIGIALALNETRPFCWFRYPRFERKVLGPNATAAQKSELQLQFQSFLAAASIEVGESDERGIYHTQEGFGRTDALARIGNVVFALDMNNWDNLAHADAPVRFPQIWDASWFTWVQYNASISNPMSRNIGEALGVKAPAKLYGCCASKMQSAILFQDLWEVEKLLSGPKPFQDLSEPEPPPHGLESPKWPDVFPPLDMARVARGRELYNEICAGCHLAPVDELKKLLDSGQDPWWKRDKAQPYPFLSVKEIPIGVVGTDPNQAMDFLTRTADSGDLKMGRLTAADGLDKIIKNMSLNFYQQNDFPLAKQREWSGYQDPMAVGIRAGPEGKNGSPRPVYRPRPLNGVWALGTYLHNGSVPNLYELLSPHSERTPVFWVGSKKFDPVKVGYESAEFPGAFKYDVATMGNSNRGHEFDGDGTKLGNGVIGRRLSIDERMAIIEFLKSQ